MRYYPWLLIGLGILLLLTSDKNTAADDLNALQGSWRSRRREPGFRRR